MKICFDNALYIEKQSAHIRERIQQFNNKLYLEFGGKLFDDYHAARVLPGFDVNAKIKLLLNLKDVTEIIFCISADAIEKNKVRADIGITYDMDVLRLIDNISALGLKINSVVITLFNDQPAAETFRKRLTARGVRTYIHRPTKGYPTDVRTIVSDEGYGSNPYIETTAPLVVVTAPGPGSGKLATCLSQLYHEHKRGVAAGYAKFETFPIWNIPLKHPVNLAYEAATADLRDVNMIDPYHLEAYGLTTVNYNRDVEVFPVVRTILNLITGRNDVYRSPTDMGVNMAGYGIIDDEGTREAARQEVIRRYFKALCDQKNGLIDADIPGRIELIMQQLAITELDRRVVAPAREKAAACGSSVTAIELPDGQIVLGRNTDVMTAPSSALVNAIKQMAGISDGIHLLSPVVIEPALRMKRNVLKTATTLNLEELLVALSICAATNTMVADAVAKLPLLKGCEAHSTTMICKSDENILRKLGLNATCEPVFPSKALYAD
ncbi:MAG: DUF1846 domain-containing protein [Eubacteriales bacterium]|nr:DUF1846 domain-containing protein [Eubacteriales bacterium]